MHHICTGNRSIFSEDVDKFLLETYIVGKQNIQTKKSCKAVTIEALNTCIKLTLYTHAR